MTEEMIKSLTVEELVRIAHSLPPCTALVEALVSYLEEAVEIIEE